ncbi:MAG TPA: threonine/serine dehydratase [Dongiaceae bacterium]|nr:threonine/serine dehydratase [Dongiaceae bacterium]
MTSSASLAISITDVNAAAERLRGEAVRTPLLRSRDLEAATGAKKAFIKPEVLQRTGSFKFRGAYNKLAAARAADPGLSKVVAFSSGNHAQGVAAAAAILGLGATIVMPKDAPQAKIGNTRRLGAEVVLYDRWKESREEIAADLARRHAALIVPPYDDPYVMAGQGTIGLEIAADLQAQNLEPDVLLVPCSGGGLAAGVATALRHHFPRIAIYAVEPVGFDDLAKSLAAGHQVANADGPVSICDALMAKQPGKLTFPIHQQLLAGSLAIPDEAALAAMAFAFDRLKLVMEPGGALALGAALRGPLDLKGKTVVVICSGGNVDAPMMQRALAQGHGLP